MTTVTVATTIVAPIERVFSVFADFEHWADRVSNIREIEMLTTGGFELGTRWLETRDMLAQQDTSEMEVTAFERNRTYTITHHRVGTRIDTVFTFEPFEEGTRVQIECDFGGAGLAPRLPGPVGWAIGARAHDVLSRDLADLKASMETASV
jgi:hypothetical protein